MKKLKYILFIFVLFLTPHVFAQDFTVSNSNITSPNSGGTGKYTGTEIYNTGTANVYNMNTRYNGRLSRIVFNLSPGGYAETTSHFDLGKTYTLTLNMATDDWRNNFGSVSVKCNSSSGTELSNGRVNYISYRKINFSFSTGSNTCGFVYVDLKSKNIVSTAFTGVSNWNLSSMVITDPTYCSGSDCYTPPSGGSSDSTNQDIINANNQNTQDIINNDDKNTNNIINNNTNNTNNIIDNANQNTQDIIDNQNKNTESTNKLLGSCYKNLFNFRVYNNNNSNMTLNTSTNGFNIAASAYSVSSGYTLSDFCPECKAGKTYYLRGNSTSTNASYIYIGQTWSYNTTKTLTESMLNSNVSFYGIYPAGSGTGTVTITDIAIYEGSSNHPYSAYNEQVCSSKLDETNNVINDTNNYLKDDSDPTISDSALNDVFGRVHFTDPLSYLLTLPTQLINKIVSMSDTCSTIDLGTLYGVHLTLPCINLQNYLGSDLWNILDVILSVGLLSVILKNFYDTISNLLTLGGEKEAKEKFSMPTPMDFLAMILGGDRT